MIINQKRQIENIVNIVVKTDPMSFSLLVSRRYSIKVPNPEIRYNAANKHSGAIITANNQVKNTIAEYDGNHMPELLQNRPLQ